MSPTLAEPIGFDIDEPVGVSDEAGARARHYHGMAVHFYEPVSRQAGILHRFYALTEKWKKDTSLLSSTTEICMHPCYQQIIGLGPNVVPFILRELEREPGHWFWALKSITGEDPVRPSNRGRVREMAKDWLTWGKLI